MIPGRATTLLRPWARELMQLVREYRRAIQNLANYSGKEADLAWDAVDAAYTRILEKVYDKVDVSITEEDWEVTDE